jgi:hypothetical protein
MTLLAEEPNQTTRTNLVCGMPDDRVCHKLLGKKSLDVCLNIFTCHVASLRKKKRSVVKSVKTHAINKSLIERARKQ